MWKHVANILKTQLENSYIEDEEYLKLRFPCEEMLMVQISMKILQLPRKIKRLKN